MPRFKSSDTEDVFNGLTPKCYPAEILRRAAMKLGAVHDAASLSYLRSPPGNRLEKLVGAEDTWSIRVNQKWRIIFIWNRASRRDPP